MRKSLSWMPCRAVFKAANECRSSCKHVNPTQVLPDTSSCLSLMQGDVAYTGQYLALAGILLVDDVVKKGHRMVHTVWQFAYLLCAVEFRSELLHLMLASFSIHFQLLLQRLNPLLQELLLLLHARDNAQ